MKPGQWWTKTWSPVTGCTPAGAGCANCHAIARMNRHLPKLRGEGNAKMPATTVLCHTERLGWPLRWRKPQTVLCCMMGDLFHEKVPWTFRIGVLSTMAVSPRHTYCVLTKRYSAVLERDLFVGNMMFLMASVWDQPSADAACEAFSQLPAGVRWGLHCEPLLGEIDLWPRLMGLAHVGNPAACLCGHGHGFSRCPNTGGVSKTCHADGCQCKGFRYAGTARPSWIVSGGEAGPKARPSHPDWHRRLRDQCKAAGVPYFFKGWGAWFPADQPWTQDSPDSLRKGEQWLNRAGGQGFHGEEVWRMARMRNSGRLLDGSEHNATPWGER